VPPCVWSQSERSRCDFCRKIELASPAVLPNPINLQGNIPAALSALTKLTYETYFTCSYALHKFSTPNHYAPPHRTITLLEAALVVRVGCEDCVFFAPVWSSPGRSVLDLQINTGLKDITAIARIPSLKQLVLIGNGGKVVPGFASRLTNLECVPVGSDGLGRCHASHLLYSCRFN
jgi:hypothetical protein